MDKAATAKATRDDVVRESLISISYSVPENAKSGSAENLKGGTLGQGAVEYDGAEKYRSQLISISSQQSPNA